MKSVLLVVALLITVSVAGAAPFPVTDSGTRVAGATLVQDVDSPARNPYQITEMNGVCPNPPAQCVINFPVVNSKRVVIQHVSCEYDIPDSGTSNSGVVSVTSIGGQIVDYVQPTTTGPNANLFSLYIINTDVLLYVNKGTAASVDVSYSGAAPTSVTCTLSGYHID